MAMTRNLLLPLLCAGLLAMPSGAAAATQEGTMVEFSAQATETAANDLGRATLYAESSGSDTAELARQLNARIGRALDTASQYPTVSTQSGAASTWPVYAKDQPGHIQAWRMRTEVRLQSQDLDALARLVGKLQQDLALSGMDMSVARATRQQAISAATTRALVAFRERAELIARSLGKNYRIRQLSINDNDYMPMPRLSMQAAAARMDDAAAALPIAAGESEISVRIQGRIELVD